MFGKLWAKTSDFGLVTTRGVETIADFLGSAFSVDDPIVPILAPPHGSGFAKPRVGNPLYGCAKPNFFTGSCPYVFNKNALF